MVYVRDFLKPEKMSAEQLKHLAIVAHFCTVRMISRLIAFIIWPIRKPFRGMPWSIMRLC